MSPLQNPDGRLRGSVLRQLKAVHVMARDARRRTGKGLARQFLELARLRLSRGRLGISEYYDLCLYDEQRYRSAVETSFIGGD